MTRNQDVIKLLKLHHWVNLGVLGIAAIYLVMVFFFNLDHGIGRAIANVIIGGIMIVILALALIWVLDKTFGNVIRTLSVRHLKEQTNRYIHPSLEHTWKNAPGIFVIDNQDRSLIVTSSQTGYFPVKLVKDDILAIKIERNVTVYTKTKHGGSPFVHGGGFGFSFGSRSSSVSKMKESAVLEIQYLTANNTPEILVIPFDEDRRGAENAQRMLQML